MLLSSILTITLVDLNIVAKAKVNNVSIGWVTNQITGLGSPSSKYISDRLVAKELWRRKQTSPSGCALEYRLVYCHNSLTPVYNYRYNIKNLHMTRLEYKLTR